MSTPIRASAFREAVGVLVVAVSGVLLPVSGDSFTYLVPLYPISHITKRESLRPSLVSTQATASRNLLKRPDDSRGGSPVSR